MSCTFPPHPPLSRSPFPAGEGYVGVTAFFYCLISLRENFRFRFCETGDGNHLRKFSWEGATTISGYILIICTLKPRAANNRTTKELMFHITPCVTPYSFRLASTQGLRNPPPSRMEAMVCANFIVWSLYGKIFVFALAKQVISSPEEIFVRGCN